MEIQKYVKTKKALKFHLFHANFITSNNCRFIVISNIFNRLMLRIYHVYHDLVEDIQINKSITPIINYINIFK